MCCRQEAGPRRPSLLMTADWLFDIGKSSVPPVEIAGEALVLPTLEGEGRDEEVLLEQLSGLQLRSAGGGVVVPPHIEQPAARPVVRFRNRLPPALVSTVGEEGGTAAAGAAAMGGAAGREGLHPAVLDAAVPEPLPALMGLPRPARRYAAAAVQTTSPQAGAAGPPLSAGPVEQRGQRGPMGAADWWFDIERSAGGLAAAGPLGGSQRTAAGMAAAASSSGSLSLPMLPQFAPMQPADPALPSQQPATQQQLPPQPLPQPQQQQQQQEGQQGRPASPLHRPGSPGEAARFDQVLAWLRGAETSPQASQALPHPPPPSPATAPASSVLLASAAAAAAPAAPEGPGPNTSEDYRPYMMLSLPAATAVAGGGLLATAAPAADAARSPASSSAAASLPPPRRPYTPGPSRFALAAGGGARLAPAQPGDEGSQAAAGSGAGQPADGASKNPGG